MGWQGGWAFWAQGRDSTAVVGNGPWGPQCEVNLGSFFNLEMLMIGPRLQAPEMDGSEPVSWGCGRKGSLTCCFWGDAELGPGLPVPLWAGPSTSDSQLCLSFPDCARPGAGDDGSRQRRGGPEPGAVSVEAKELGLGQAVCKSSRARDKPHGVQSRPQAWPPGCNEVTDLAGFLVLPPRTTGGWEAPGRDLSIP